MPFYKGRGRFAYLPAVKRHLASLPGEVPMRLHDGQTVFANPNDYIGSMVYLFRDLDPAISWCLKKILRPGDCFVDVGANIGVETLPAARLVGDGGKVVAFEPNPPVFAMLERSVRANSLDQVRLIAAAVSSIEGALQISVPSDNSGCACVSSGEADGSVEVPAVRLDRHAALVGVDIRLLKIDVEGHELGVLEGAEGILKAGRVGHVLIEIWPSQTVRFSEMPAVRLLRSFGYEPSQLLKRFSIFPHLRRVVGDRVEPASCDFLFSRP